MSAVPPKTKTARLIEIMRDGDWARALGLAHTFRMLGRHGRTIKLAHECCHYPAFYRQVGVNPREAIDAGIAALKKLYPERLI